MARLRITWDEVKRRANLEKHKLDLADVTPAIFDAGLVQVGRNGRFKAIGLVNERPVAMIFKPLGSEAISVISLRPASKKERQLL